MSFFVVLAPDEHGDAISLFSPSRLAADEHDAVAALCCLSMYMSPSHTYARVGVRDPARMYTYVAVFSFLHPGRCTYVYMLRASTTTRARLYYDTCVPLH